MLGQFYMDENAFLTLASFVTSKKKMFSVRDIMRMQY